MKKINRTVTANDNSPDHEIEDVLYKAVSYPNSVFFSSNKSTANSSKNQIANMLVETNGKINLKNRSLKMSVILWITAIALGLVSIFGETSTEIKAFSALAVLWAGLWTSYVAADHNKWRLSEIAIVSALGGLMSAMMIGSNYLGLNLTLIDGIILMGLLSVAMGYIVKSRIAILTSICATLLWAMMSFMGLEPINNIAVLFPLLIGLQIFTSSRISSKLAITLAIITGYYGLIGFLVTTWIYNLIPLTFASSLLFIIGIAHHRVGKAAEDTKIFGSKTHIYFGWVVAITSAVIFQYFWLNENATASNTASIGPTGLALWKTAVSLSILAIFISGIIRFKHSQITLSGIFLLTFFSGLMPMMMWFPSWHETLAASIPGINSIPTFGIAIGAAIVAASIGFSLNGIRRQSVIMLFLGLPFLGVEGFLLITPNLMSIDHVIIFFVALLTAFTVGGVIAGNSLTSQTPAPRFKHSYS